MSGDRKDKDILLFRSEFDGKIYPLRSFEAFMDDMKDFIESDCKRMKSKELWAIRDLWFIVKKQTGSKLRGLKCRELDRVKIVNKYKKSRIYEAEINYSKTISDQKNLRAEYIKDKP